MLTYFYLSEFLGTVNLSLLYISFSIYPPGGGSLATTLQAAEVKAISVAECQQYWSNTGETHICVWEQGSKGACNVSNMLTLCILLNCNHECIQFGTSYH